MISLKKSRSIPPCLCRVTSKDVTHGMNRSCCYRPPKWYPSENPAEIEPVLYELCAAMLTTPHYGILRLHWPLEDLKNIWGRGIWKETDKRMRDTQQIALMTIRFIILRVLFFANVYTWTKRECRRRASKNWILDLIWLETFKRSKAYLFSRLFWYYEVDSYDNCLLLIQITKFSYNTQRWFNLNAN